ncbi:MAG: hypothetical protein ACO3BD_04160 [Chitinophagaceae bacterium]
MHTVHEKIPITPTRVKTLVFKPTLEEWTRVEVFLKRFERFTPQQMIDTYLFYLDLYFKVRPPDYEKRFFALMHCFKKRFGKSPIYLNEDYLLVFGEKITLGEKGYMPIQPSVSSF